MTVGLTDPRIIDKLPESGVSEGLRSAVSSLGGVRDTALAQNEYDVF